MEGADHPSVKIFGYVLMGVILAVMVMLLWISRTQEERDAWDIVPIGGQCAVLGAEERTYGGDAVFCAAFPRYGLQIWSLKQADVATPTPAPPDPREAQVLVCMQQSGLERQNCAAGIEQYEAGR